ncbi:MAG: prepilin peptidase [Lachnospiraceae bacterium]|nr:prepilin peptidase [Lachnospiraceae bacterium]
MEAVGLLGLLGVCGFEDIKIKRIRLVVVNLFAILGIVFHLVYERISWLDMLGGAAIGIVLLIIGYFSKEKIGYGDGLLFMATGIYLGFWNNLALLWMSTALAGIYGLIMLLFKKKKKSSEIPLIPFVLATYVVSLIINGGTL